MFAMVQFQTVSSPEPSKGLSPILYIYISHTLKGKAKPRGPLGFGLPQPRPSPPRPSPARGHGQRGVGHAAQAAAFGGLGVVEAVGHVDHPGVASRRCFFFFFRRPTFSFGTFGGSGLESETVWSKKRGTEKIADCPTLVHTSNMSTQIRHICLETTGRTGPLGLPKKHILVWVSPILRQPFFLGRDFSQKR